MIAAIYARKSVDDSGRSDEARSTTRQVERAMEYAHAKGWLIDPRYIFVDDAGAARSGNTVPGSMPSLPRWNRARPSAS
jgi:DNA invertase Pin-like site-specific DNA recombinase